MSEILTGILIIIVGYLFGSLSFAVWVTKLKLGIDVRDAGSHHATTTNTIRQAGWGAGAVVFVFDILKGFVPTYIALTYYGNDLVVALTAMAAVAGHCWPVFAQFKGGMGLGTAAGAISTVYPLGVLVALAILITIMLIIKHSARAALVIGIILGPLFWALGQDSLVIGIGLSTGVIIFIRFLTDWNREYKELWLDREQKN